MLAVSLFHAGPPPGLLAAARQTALGHEQRGLFDSPADSLAQQRTADAEERVEWSERDVVELHWTLLCSVRDLADLETPLEEKIDTLNWVFTDPHKDARPFSFVNCLKVVGTSPLSPTPYFGLLDVQEIRDWIACHVPGWMRATLALYPPWVQELVRKNPQHVVDELEKNPQWINEQVKRRTSTDLLSQARGAGELRGEAP